MKNKSVKNDAIEAKTVLNENGRIVIPVAIRERLGMKAGDTLSLRLDGEVVVIESQQARIRRVQESLNKLIPASRVLSEELIAERREEARREMEEWLG